MLKFIKHHMISEGIEIFPLVSFLIFFIFFVLLLVYVMRMKKGHVDSMSQIPLSEEPVEGRQKLSHETSN